MAEVVDEPLNLCSWPGALSADPDILIADFEGKTATIQIVDRHSGRWGHIKAHKLKSIWSRAAIQPREPRP